MVGLGDILFSAGPGRQVVLTNVMYGHLKTMLEAHISIFAGKELTLQ